MEIIRYFDTEMRASEKNDMEVEGYALKFDKETVIGSGAWGYREKISKTALDNADLSDVVFNYNHNLDSIMARTSNDSLKLNTDSTGLKISTTIVDTSDGVDLYKRIKNGLITRMSFWAVVKKSKWTFVEDDSDEMDLREIEEFGRFIDVSAVTFPAYEDTSITARGIGLMPCYETERKERERQIMERQIKKRDKILGRMKI